jgi:hypothetical protein
MLSATNTILDVKGELVNIYSAFGFASDGDFVTSITNVSVQTYLARMLPALGNSVYAEIQGKNKINLTEIETQIYWAEVCFICCDFLTKIANAKRQTIHGSAKSITAEGYQQSVTDQKQLGYDDAALSFWRRGVSYMGMAGYRVNRLQRGGTFYYSPETEEYK